MKVIPAPLEPTIEGLSNQMTRLLPFFDRFSIDVQDGEAVSTKTASISEIVSFFKENRPLFKDITLDFDVMVNDYEGALEAISGLVPDIHVGNVVVLRSVLKGASLPTNNNFPIGLSINVQDEIDDIARKYDLNKVPCIQIMTVHAGAQGQSFIPDMLNKIDQLKQLDYRNSIYIDGAVNNETIPVVLSQKELPDFVCVGSYLTKSGDALEEHVEYLKSIE